MGVPHRLSAVLVCLGLIAGNAAICDGWKATPEARMACCADGGDCPMHQGESAGSVTHHALTQAQADACCASSKREESSRSTPTFVGFVSSAVLGPGILLPATVPALVRSDDWRIVSPIPAPLVPKYVLLSVFLV